MSDADLSSLRVNAERLLQFGLPTQVRAASDLLPLIEAEQTKRTAAPKAVPRPRTRTARKKVLPVTGHQTALPSNAEKTLK
ncbi:hypothetical protein [Brevundimonas sp. FT23042]|uniref:hypothetical protein n=1 Tax=Brevundimonas sp. FT23042 TaxID=3393749 RepID=UPI003B5870EF